MTNISINTIIIILIIFIIIFIISHIKTNQYVKNNLQYHVKNNSPYHIKNNLLVQHSSHKFEGFYCRVHYNEYIITREKIPDTSITSVDLLNITIDNYAMKQFLLSVQQIFGTGKCIWGYKGLNKYEIYIYRQAMTIRHFIVCFKKLFPYDEYNFDPLIKLNPFLVSFDIDMDVVVNRKTIKLNPYYFLNDDIHTQIMYECTYNHIGEIKHRSTYLYPTDLTKSNIDNLSNNAGIIDTNNIQLLKQIITELNFKYYLGHTTLANKPTELGLYPFRISSIMFLNFLIDNNYSEIIINYVKQHLTDFDNFDSEIGIHFDKQTGKITRTAFYGIM